MNQNDRYAQQMAERLVELLKNSDAPWQKTWTPGVPPPHGFGMSYNALSGKNYRGSNVLALLTAQIQAGYQDERWLTYKQARELGCQVKKGEKGVQIKYHKFPDPDAPPKLDKEGNEVPQFPQTFFSTVFNGQQIEGMPPMPTRQLPSERERHAMAEEILDRSGAIIKDNGGDKAFYSPQTDTIHLPVVEQFKSIDAYYAVALHELAHWTGHKSRMNRDLSGKFGSIEYAKEELRAEIASMMMADRLGIGHDPSNHAAYVKHWIAIVQDDPKELMRACNDAEKICQELGVQALDRERQALTDEKKKEKQKVLENSYHQAKRRLQGKDNPRARSSSPTRKRSPRSKSREQEMVM